MSSSRTEEKFTSVSRELVRLAQSAERQQHALVRLNHALQSGQVITGQETFIQDMIEAGSAVEAAIQALGIAGAGVLPAEDLGRVGEEPSPSREHEKLLAICSVSQTVNSTLDLTQVLDIVLDTIIRLMGAERAFVMLRDEDTGEFVFRNARNMDKETITGSSFEISLGIVKRVASEGTPVVTTNAQADPRFRSHQSIMNYSLRSILCVPILVKKHVIGVIYADSRIRTALFSDKDLDVLVTFANQVATAIDNARLFESVVMSKNLLDNIFASIPSGVITVDTSGRINALNPVAEKILDRPLKSCLGFPYTEVFKAAWGADLSSLVDLAMTREQRFVGYEIEPSTSECEGRSLRLSVSPLKDNAGNCQGVTIVVDDLTETRRLQAVREMFKRYVSPVVVDRLPADAEELRLGGHRQEISVLFADLRGFTSLSEGLPPEGLVVVLNQYLSLAAQAILAHEGTLDKFMGDAVMAIFNAPLPQENHPLRAVKAAVAIRENVGRFHRAQVGRLPALQYGIGINVGESVVGNVGTPVQMNYTAIGDTVNVAKRLQEMAAGGQILLSQEAFERVAEYIHARPLALAHIKGRKSPEQVYELISLK